MALSFSTSHMTVLATLIQNCHKAMHNAYAHNYGLKDQRRL